MLAKGVIGVDFKKNEKVYDSSKSQVFKMLQEMDKEPKEELTESSHQQVLEQVPSIHMPTVVYESPKSVISAPVVQSTTQQQQHCNTVTISFLITQNILLTLFDQIMDRR